MRVIFLLLFTLIIMPSYTNIPEDTVDRYWNIIKYERGSDWTHYISIYDISEILQTLPFYIQHPKEFEPFSWIGFQIDNTESFVEYAFIAPHFDYNLEDYYAEKPVFDECMKSYKYKIVKSGDTSYRYRQLNGHESNIFPEISGIVRIINSETGEKSILDNRHYPLDFSKLTPKEIELYQKIKTFIIKSENEQNTREEFVKALKENFPELQEWFANKPIKIALQNGDRILAFQEQFTFKEVGSEHYGFRLRLIYYPSEKINYQGNILQGFDSSELPKLYYSRIFVFTTLVKELRWQHFKPLPW